MVAIREENRKKKAATSEVEDICSENSNSDSDRVEEGRGVTHFKDALPSDHIPNPTLSLRPGVNSGCGGGPDEVKESTSL